MNPIVITLLSLLLVGCSSPLPSQRVADGPRSTRTTPSEHEQFESETHSGLASETRGLGGIDRKIAYIGEGFFGVSIEPEPNRVIISAHEKSRANGEYYEWTAHRTTDFEVQALCGRHANEFYVFGSYADGSQVLERWILEPWQTGAYFTERKTADTAIGTPVEPFDTIVRYNGPFIEPADRPNPVVTRTALHTPSIPGEVLDLEADPEGRFLVFLVRDAQGKSAFLSYDLSSGSQSTLATASLHPRVADAFLFRFLDSTHEGRLISASLPGRSDVLYLVDEKNDGVFESSMILKNGAEHYYALPGFTLTKYP